MSRLYVVSYSGTFTAAGGDADFLWLLPAADRPIRLRGLRLAQHTDIGDAHEEGLRLEIGHQMNAVAGSGGSILTPVDIDRAANTTAAFTARANDSNRSSSGGGGTQVLEELAWNIRFSPSDLRWTDEREVAMAINPHAVILFCASTPLDDIGVDIQAWVEEYP